MQIRSTLESHILLRVFCSEIVSSYYISFIYAFEFQIKFITEHISFTSDQTASKAAWSRNMAQKQERDQTNIVTHNRKMVVLCMLMPTEGVIRTKLCVLSCHCYVSLLQLYSVLSDILIKIDLWIPLERISNVLRITVTPYTCRYIV